MIYRVYETSCLCYPPTDTIALLFYYYNGQSHLTACLLYHPSLTNSRNTVSSIRGGFLHLPMMAVSSMISSPPLLNPYHWILSASLSTGHLLMVSYVTETYYKNTYRFLDVFWMFFAPWDTTLNEWTSSCYLTHDDDCEHHIL